MLAEQPPCGCARKEAAISFEHWILLIGGLLLIMALAHPFVKRLPITTSLIYLLLGIALGPAWLGFIAVDPIAHAKWLHRAAEIAVIISLFTVGLKLRLSVFDRRLRPALFLAVVSMILTVGLVAAAGVWLLGLPLGAAILLGAILAPTDPVLASDVQTKNPGDQDKLRLTLTAEGGLNDGTAFPFVMLGLGLLGLHDLGDNFSRWWLVDVLWAVVGGFGIGGLLGYGVGRYVLYLTARHQKVVPLGEYLLLGLIGVAYGLTLEFKAYGFLAVFAAGVGVRAAERQATGPSKSDQAVKDAIAGAASKNSLQDPNVAAAYFTGELLTMNEQLERILEVALVLMLGAVLLVAGLAPAAAWFAPLLFLVIRPLAALPLLAAGRFSVYEYSLVAWFGIRGIGSIYYLMYAIEHGLPQDLAKILVSLTLTVIALSIVVHGVSVTPLLMRYRRQQGGR